MSNYPNKTERIVLIFTGFYILSFIALGLANEDIITLILITLFGTVILFLESKLYD